MGKFRKKPVEIEAVQLTYENILNNGTPENTLLENFIQSTKMQLFVTYDIKDSQYALIETLEGTMRANANDWIIKGVNGELYPCKPDIFEKTYEPVE